MSRGTRIGTSIGKALSKADQKREADARKNAKPWRVSSKKKSR